MPRSLQTPTMIFSPAIVPLPCGNTTHSELRRSYLQRTRAAVMNFRSTMGLRSCKATIPASTCGKGFQYAGDLQKRGQHPTNPVRLLLHNLMRRGRGDYAVPSRKEHLFPFAISWYRGYQNALFEVYLGLTFLFRRLLARQPLGQLVRLSLVQLEKIQAVPLTMAT